MRGRPSIRFAAMMKMVSSTATCDRGVCQAGLLLGRRVPGTIPAPPAWTRTPPRTSAVPIHRRPALTALCGVTLGCAQPLTRRHRHGRGECVGAVLSSLHPAPPKPGSLRRPVPTQRPVGVIRPVAGRRGHRRETSPRDPCRLAVGCGRGAGGGGRGADCARPVEHDRRGRITVDDRRIAGDRAYLGGVDGLVRPPCRAARRRAGRSASRAAEMRSLLQVQYSLGSRVLRYQ